MPKVWRKMTEPLSLLSLPPDFDRPPQLIFYAPLLPYIIQTGMRDSLAKNIQHAMTM